MTSSALPAPPDSPAAHAAEAPILRGRGLRVKYDDHVVLDDVDVEIPRGRFTVIVGPNACGKSTLLKTLSRVLKPTAGTVWLGEHSIHSLPPKRIATQLGMLPQTPVAPEGILVEDLVGRGRFPHQGLLHQWSREDTEAVEQALHHARVADLRDRPLAELSGGQRQRVWIAMALAQQTPLLLLDEPTTFLDISHQVDVLNLCRSMQRAGTTVVAVLHDLNLAFRYADHLIVMSRGEITATGTPADIVTAGLLASVFGLACRIIPDPLTGSPLVLPLPEPGLEEDVSDKVGNVDGR